VFTLGAFVPPDVPVGRVEIIPPAIDPLSPKNMPIDDGLAASVLDWIGVDTARPLLVQVSRFDPWKDPLGVIAAYRTVKRQVPAVQLALVGSMALDDPEGWRVYRQIAAAAADDPDISLFTNLTGVGNIEVNAFQRHADVVIQKSLREGFGLVVSEATWKGTPVVAGRAGGIPLQLPDGVGGRLVDTTDQCAQAVLDLLANSQAARRLASAGAGLVRERFLLPRLIGDELRLITSLLGHTLAAPKALAAAGTADEDRDPVCGMRVNGTGGGRHQTTYEGVRFRFCSASCLRQFTANPQLFWRAVNRARAAGQARRDG
jgi:trehalose synthase